MNTYTRIKEFAYRLFGHSPYHSYILSTDNNSVVDDFIQKTIELCDTKVLKNVPQKKVLNVAVLGCADPRYVDVYENFFKRLFKQKINLVIYELSIKHLPRKSFVVQHDCRKRLPQKFDVIYSHMLINFLPSKDQPRFLNSTHDSLEEGGLAVHIYCSDSDSEYFRVGAKVYKLSEQAKQTASLLSAKSKSGKVTVIKKSEPYF